MKEFVSIHTLEISLREEKQSFQIRLPREASRLIGFEITTAFPISQGEEINPEEFKAGLYGVVEGNIRKMGLNLPVGEVILQGYDNSDLFFTEDIALEERNNAFLDFTNSTWWGNQSWIEGRSFNEQEINLSGESTIISGFYKDRLGKYLNRDLKYQVNIYLWFEKEAEL